MCVPVPPLSRVSHDEIWLLFVLLAFLSRFSCILSCIPFKIFLHSCIPFKPLAHLTGSGHMMREFNKKWEQDYVRKTAETLQAAEWLTGEELPSSIKRKVQGSSDGTVRAIVTEMSEEGKNQNKIFVARCLQGGTRLTLSGDLWSSDGMVLFAIFGHCINEEFELKNTVHLVHLQHLIPCPA